MAALTDGLCILFTQLEYEKIKRENVKEKKFSDMEPRIRKIITPQSGSHYSKGE